MRVADFFCGGGGFSEGFRQAGFEIVFAVDKWAPAVNTYKGNKPGVNVIQGDVISISNLPEEEFEKLVPDSEVIIGSPPCQSFSHSNKSGNADKSLGIQLIEAYLRIIARKKYKPGAVLKYWVLENVPAVKNYIKEEYTAADLGLEGDFVLRTRDGASGKYNAKYFGAPTNRERYLCGDFPRPVETKNDDNVIPLKAVLDSLGDPLRKDNDLITDINYPDLKIDAQKVTDQHYIYELADFECQTAKRLKQDKGYMGKMSFPENLDKPARTVMATMTASAREAMVLGYGENRYRLPTVREAACMMSFPIDYWFYGESKGIKHTLVGNAVPPKLSYAIAVAIANAEGQAIPSGYLPIHHDENDSDLPFLNLNGVKYEIRKEQPKRIVSKFKYHIPYLIYSAYRVELTNYHSKFDINEFKWDVEIHYSQGKDKAKVLIPSVNKKNLPDELYERIKAYLEAITPMVPTTYSYFQKLYCMTSEERKAKNKYGPYELLDSIRKFIDEAIPQEDHGKIVEIGENTYLPYAILAGYYTVSKIIKRMQ